MKLRYKCPQCEAENAQQWAQQWNDAAEPVSCLFCDWERAISTETPETETPSVCLVCGNRDLWRQKDFPQSIGLTFVAAGAILSSIAWYYHRPVWALGILLAFAAADLLLFRVMPDVLVCYHCHTRHSGGDLSEHPAFDHETAERYRQEKLRLEEAEKSSPR